MTLLICRNDSFRATGKRLFTVIDTIPAHESVDGSATVVVVERDVKNVLPSRWSRDALQRAIDAGELLSVPTPAHSFPAKPSKSDIVKMEVRWKRIEAIVHDQGLYERATRNQVLLAHAEAIGTTKETLLDDLRKYWLRGLNKEALMGDYWRCGYVDPNNENSLTVTLKGEEGSRQIALAPTGTKARGRRPDSDSGYEEPMKIPVDVQREILMRARKYYLADESRSQRSTADHVLRKLYAYRDEEGKLLRDANGAAMLKPLGQRPTQRQIVHLIKKGLSTSELIRKRESDADFVNNYAGSTGSVEQDTHGIADTYELDSTFVDMWLVSEFDRTTIIGKATYYLVIDRDSGLIVGFYITLENPSLEQAKQAIVSICSDWKAVCEELGVPYVAAAFPARGVIPERFFADRAELISKGSNLVISGLGTSITNPPAKHARKKPLVESGFMQTHVPLKDTAPGYEPPANAKKRRGKKYEKDACLTLRDLAKVLLEIIIAHNLKERTGRHVPAKEAFAGLSQTRAAIWARGVESRSGAPARYSMARVREQLWIPGMAVVRQDGIHFRDCIYTFDEIKREDWLALAGIKSFEVAVRHSPASCNEIIVYDRVDPARKYIGRLTELCAKDLANKSFAEAETYAKARASLKRQGNLHNQAMRIGVAEEIETFSAPKHAQMKAATKGKGVTARKSGHIEMRDAEMKAGRAASHSLTGSGVPFISASSVARIADGVAQAEMPVATPKKPSIAKAKPTAASISTAVMDELSMLLAD